jgi:hypothetical protein
MAANATAVWRARNAITVAATGSSYTSSTGALTIATVVAHGLVSGNAFYLSSLTGTGGYASLDGGPWTATSGTTGTTINATVTTGLGASTITGGFVQLGSNNNGGGFDTGISGYGTDYSQQNSPQVSQSSTANTSTATTTLTDTGASFTTALIGNGIRVSGTSITTTYTFITGVPTSTTLTLQTSPGTAGTAVSYNIGGGWADFWTNTTGAPVVAGNTIYILGGTSPSYGSPDYAPSTYYTFVSGSSTAGLVRFIGDPSTPSNNGYSGYPLINATQNLLFYNLYGILIKNLYIFAGSAAQSGLCLNLNSGPIIVENIVYDQNGYDVGVVFGSTDLFQFINVEMFSSQSKRTTNVSAVANIGVLSSLVGCNIHDCIGPGVTLPGYSSIDSCIIANNGGAGITITSTAIQPQVVKNSTIDGNKGSAVVITTQASLAAVQIFNNIISNHTQSGTYGMTVSAGTSSANNLVKGFVDYNTYYNNTTDLNAISYGAHDTSNSGTAPNTISSTPYVASSTENYTLA